VANTKIEANLSAVYKTVILLGASLSPLLFVPLLLGFNKGKETRTVSSGQA
jgi:hypothetical protein